MQYVISDERMIDQTLMQFFLLRCQWNILGEIVVYDTVYGFVAEPRRLIICIIFGFEQSVVTVFAGCDAETIIPYIWAICRKHPHCKTFRRSMTSSKLLLLNYITGGVTTEICPMMIENGLIYRIPQ